MKKVFWFCLSLMVASSVRAALSAEEIYEKVSASVLTLEVENFQKEKFVGSAFLALRPGLAVTAWHVVHDAKHIQARLPGNQAVQILGLVAKDEAQDLAILAVESPTHPCLSLASSNPRVGAKIFVIGSPKGLDFSIADGLISQLRAVDGQHQYQLSCPISPGNSGGPVVNDRGEVLGVVSWRKPDAQNLSFAIPSAEVARLQMRLSKVPIPPGEFAKEITPERIGAVANQRDSKPEGFAEFRQALSEHAGKQVKITLDDGSERREYTFEAPLQEEVSGK